MKKLFILILLSLLSGGFWMTAAGANGSIKLLCRPHRDSVLLRWAPADKEIWKLGNRHGYVVARQTILRNGQPVDTAALHLLVAEPQKPAPLAAWESLIDDRFVAAAAQCIFDSGEPAPTGNLTAVARRYREEQNRFAMALFAADQSPAAARLSGLSFTDRSAQSNEKYLYLVYIPVRDSLVPADTAFAFTGPSEYRPLPKPQKLSAQWGDRQVLLSWNILYLNSIYNSYIVEKSTDGQHYTPVSDNALVQLADAGVSPTHAYRTDSLPDNRSVWYYRVRGINAFGETGPPGDSVTGRGRLPLTQAPVITRHSVVNNEQVLLEWDYPAEMNEYIAGFRIYSSPTPSGIKQKIYESLSPDERRFTDTHPAPTNYYIISAFAAHDEKISPLLTYAELIDSLPPHRPLGLRGTIDSTGLVYLSWQANTNPDSDGYRVYRSNSREGEYLLVLPAVVKDTFFVDSINLHTLTQEVFYRLRAVDRRQNLSEAGEVLALRRPDLIPPVSPAIKSVEVQKGALLLTWINSSSVDVVRHHLYRKTKSDTVFRHLAGIALQPGKAPAYTDRDIQAGETYIYYLTAEDGSGLESPPSSPQQQQAAGGTAEKITLRHRVYPHRTVLQWSVASDKPVARVLVYRAVGEQDFTLLGNSTADRYEDAQVTPGTGYRYRIRVVYDDDSSSALSDEVRVKP